MSMTTEGQVTPLTRELQQAHEKQQELQRALLMHIAAMECALVHLKRTLIATGLAEAADPPDADSRPCCEQNP